MPLSVQEIGRELFNLLLIPKSLIQDEASLNKGFFCVMI